MIATIVLTGGWEIIFYLMCLYFAIDLFCELPKILNWILDKITKGGEHHGEDEPYAYLIGWIGEQYSYLLQEFNKENENKRDK